MGGSGTLIVKRLPYFRPKPMIISFGFFSRRELGLDREEFSLIIE